MATHLILADDHSVVTEWVKLMLQYNPEINCDFEARNGLQVLDYLLSNKADLILMDLEMPEMNGIKCAEKVVELNPETKVIAFTHYAE
ncbi:MAG: response regulator transcription factor [Saprospiraceae bacterium]